MAAGVVPHIINLSGPSSQVQLQEITDVHYQTRQGKARQEVKRSLALESKGYPGTETSHHPTVIAQTL